MLVVAACTSVALSICFHKTFYWNSIAGGRSGEVATAGPGSTRQEEGDSAGELMRGIRCIKLAVLLGSLVPIIYIIVRAMTQILVYESISHPLYKNCLQPQEEEGEADSGNCNILLYFGLGLMCVGSVIAFVGGWWWWGRVNIYLDEEQLLQIPICSSRRHISYSQLLCITSAILFEEWGTSKG